jgi:hypothetical protein
MEEINKLTPVEAQKLIANRTPPSVNFLKYSEEQDTENEQQQLLQQETTPKSEQFSQKLAVTPGISLVSDTTSETLESPCAPPASTPTPSMSSSSVVKPASSTVAIPSGTHPSGAGSTTTATNAPSINPLVPSSSYSTLIYSPSHCLYSKTLLVYK